MNNEPSLKAVSGMSRRTLLRGAATACLSAIGAPVVQSLTPALPDTSALKRAAKQSGKILGTYTVQHELYYDSFASAIIANTLSMIADGNDLKFSNRLRPAPDSFDFRAGDAVVAWVEQHSLLLRGHCLVWWNALPAWYSSYVTPANAKQVMTDHITTVVKHYAGRIYSWDVVNEPIYHDNRPDVLRRRPWLDFIGPEYIDLAFHAAHAADPHAFLVLNECYIEHATPGEIGRRAALLALATRLQKANVPITHVGIQGHLRGNTPLDRRGMADFGKQIHDLGLEIMITELDCDSVNVPGALVEQTAASKYAEFLEFMGPYVKVITLESLHEDRSLPVQANGFRQYLNLLNSDYQLTPPYYAAVDALVLPAAESGQATHLKQSAKGSR
jgi:endo-1,4-beta-xylanase